MFADGRKKSYRQTGNQGIEGEVKGFVVTCKLFSATHDSQPSLSLSAGPRLSCVKIKRTIHLAVFSPCMPGRVMASFCSSPPCCMCHRLIRSQVRTAVFAPLIFGTWKFPVLCLCARVLSRGPPILQQRVKIVSRQSVVSSIFACPVSLSESVLNHKGLSIDLRLRNDEFVCFNRPH